MSQPGIKNFCWGACLKAGALPLSYLNAAASPNVAALTGTSVWLHLWLQCLVQKRRTEGLGVFVGARLVEEEGEGRPRIRNKSVTHGV